MHNHSCTTTGCDLPGAIRAVRVDNKDFITATKTQYCTRNPVLFVVGDDDTSQLNGAGHRYAITESHAQPQADAGLRWHRLPRMAASAHSADRPGNTAARPWDTVQSRN